MSGVYIIKEINTYVDNDKRGEWYFGKLIYKDVYPTKEGLKSVLVEIPIFSIGRGFVGKVGDLVSCDLIPRSQKDGEVLFLVKNWLLCGNKSQPQKWDYDPLVTAEKIKI